MDSYVYVCVCVFYRAWEFQFHHLSLKMENQSHLISSVLSHDVEKKETRKSSLTNLIFRSLFVCLVVILLFIVYSSCVIFSILFNKRKHCPWGDRSRKLQKKTTILGFNFPWVGCSISIPVIELIPFCYLLLTRMSVCSCSLWLIDNYDGSIVSPFQ